MDYYIPKMFFVAYFFFFQAEDGIRDGHVTGVQTCALPIYQDEDFIERGVQFIPDGWTRNDMFDFAEKNLRLADAYMEDIKNRKILLFCKIPLALAKKTLKAMESGREKISRNEVEEIVNDITKD